MHVDPSKFSETEAKAAAEAARNDSSSSSSSASTASTTSKRQRTGKTREPEAVILSGLDLISRLFGEYAEPRGGHQLTLGYMKNPEHEKNPETPPAILVIICHFNYVRIGQTSFLGLGGELKPLPQAPHSKEPPLFESHDAAIRREIPEETLRTCLANALLAARLLSVSSKLWDGKRDDKDEISYSHSNLAVLSLIPQEITPEEFERLFDRANQEANARLALIQPVVLALSENFVKLRNRKKPLPEQEHPAFFRKLATIIEEHEKTIQAAMGTEPKDNPIEQDACKFVRYHFLPKLTELKNALNPANPLLLPSKTTLIPLIQGVLEVCELRNNGNPVPFIAPSFTQVLAGAFYAQVKAAITKGVTDKLSSKPHLIPLLKEGFQYQPVVVQVNDKGHPVRKEDVGSRDVPIDNQSVVGQLLRIVCPTAHLSPNGNNWEFNPALVELLAPHHTEIATHLAAYQKQLIEKEIPQFFMGDDLAPYQQQVTQEARAYFEFIFGVLPSPRLALSADTEKGEKREAETQAVQFPHSPSHIVGNRAASSFVGGGVKLAEEGGSGTKRRQTGSEKDTDSQARQSHSPSPSPLPQQQ